jgi:hypothetical protein
VTPELDEPVWEAVRFERIMEAGRTKPLLIECELASGNATTRGRFVTKMMGLPEVQDFSLCHEFVGGRLARLFGVYAPDPALIHVSSEFVDAVRDDVGSGLCLNPGLAVGSQFLPNLQPFPGTPALAEDEVPAAARLFAFDVLTQNADRRVAAPNCARRNGAIVAYDFENAFGFRLAILRPDPWRVSALPFCRNHLFFDALQKAQPDWAVALAPFFTVTREAVSNVCSTIPESWQAVGSEIDTHIAAVLPRWSEFVRELGESLGESL